MPDTPKDLSLEIAVGIAVAGIVAAKWLITSGPVHVLFWIVAIGAITIATARVGGKVLG